MFQIDAPLISKNMREIFHGLARAKTFSVNYQLAAAIQAMDCGSTDVATLVAFLDLPASWSTVTSHMKQCEKVMGPIQISLADESKKDALADEINCTGDADELVLHECSIKGHEHPPLPKLKGSYGK